MSHGATAAIADDGRGASPLRWWALGVFVTAPDVFSDEAAKFVSDLGVTELEAHQGTLITASYSREAETAADTFSIAVMQQLGRPPKAMTRPARSWIGNITRSRNRS